MSSTVIIAMRVARSAILALAMGAVSAAWGQALSDPTRPPPAWMAAHAKAAPGTMMGDGTNAEPAPRLQSLLLGRSHKYAIIDGQLVAVGESFRDGKLVQVRPGEAVLQTKLGRQTLKLFPDVQKLPVKPVAADAARAPAKAKRSIRLTETGNNVAKEKK
jgi:hypothetical protein